MSKVRKIVKPLFTFSLCVGVSIVLFHYLGMDAIFSDESIISHYGIFLGFGLTIYTFIISILDSITDRIDKQISDSRRDLVKGDIFNAVQHLKENVIAIFIIFVFHLIVDLAQSKEICQKQLDILQQAIFIYSIFILYDIASVLFGMSDISITLLKGKKNKDKQ